MFTRRHYASVAATLAMAHNSTSTLEEQVAVTRTAHKFADNFEWISPTFNRAAFIAAFEQFVQDCANGNWRIVRAAVEGKK